jgi:hypothetical protein
MTCELTPEAQAVLDAAVEWQRAEGADHRFSGLSLAVDAYRESLPNPPEPFARYMCRLPDAPDEWGYGVTHTADTWVVTDREQVWEVQITPVWRVR